MSRLTMFLLVVSLSSAGADRSAHERITVKIRNGRTGGRIWIASPYVFVGNVSAADFDFRYGYRRTSWWNDAVVDVSGANSPEIRVWKDFISRDCRFDDGDVQIRTFDFAGKTLAREPVYPVKQILATGIVTENRCGTATSTPEPGVLTIYVIPLTFKELWAL